MLGSRCLWYRGSSASCQVRIRPIVRQYHAAPSLSSPFRSKDAVQSVYIDTVPPSEHETLAARKFFETHLPTKAWTATEWRQVDPSGSNSGLLTPEVVFLGRSNSGKSSLLNAVLQNPQLCRVGPKPGKTSTMHAWSLSAVELDKRGIKKANNGDRAPKLTVLDTPGWGHGSHHEWGEQIMKYLRSRRQLRRAFVLVNPKHGLKTSDLQILELLKTQGISHQLIACKSDSLSATNLREALYEIEMQLETKFGDKAKRHGPTILTINDILAVGGLGDGKSNKKLNDSNMRGVQEVQWAVLRAAGLEQYAKSILQNGGLPPKQKMLNSPQNAVTVSPREDIEVAPLQLASVASSKEPPQRPVQPKPAPSIGIGIEELMAMTIPASSGRPTAGPSPKELSTTGVSTTRRQRMRAGAK